MTKKNINIRLEESVWMEAKMAAVKSRATLQDWLTEAIQEKLSEAGYDYDLRYPKGGV